MTIETYALTVRCFASDGEPKPGARVEARLTRPEEIYSEDPS